MAAPVWIEKLVRSVGQKLQAIDHKSHPQVAQILSKCTYLTAVAALFQSAGLKAYLVHLSDLSATADVRKLQEQLKARGDERLYHLFSSPHIKRNFELLIRAFVLLYSIWTLQTLLVLLLDVPQLARYRFLDCLLLGRLIITARSSTAARYVSLLLLTFLLSARLLLTSVRFRRYFHIDCLDFMLRSSASVERQVGREQLECHKMSRKRHNADDETFEIFYRKCEPENSLDIDDTNSSSSSAEELDQGGESTLFARAHVDALHFQVLKLNRRPKWWFRYNCLAALCMSCFVVFIFFWFVFFAYIAAPTTLTKRGYELAYPHCLAYLAKRAQSNRTLALEFSFIYEPTVICKSTDGQILIGDHIYSLDEAKTTDATCRLQYGHSERERATWPTILPFKDLNTGWYHATRSLVDYAQTLILITDLTAFVSANVLFVTYACIDIIVNATLIHGRLACLHQSLLEEQDQRARANYHHPSTPAIQLQQVKNAPRSPSSISCQSPRLLVDDELNWTLTKRRRRRHQSTPEPAGRGGILSLCNHEQLAFSHARRQQQQKELDLLARELEYLGQTSDHLDELEDRRLLETILLQALLADHFRTTLNCNRFVATYCLMIGSIWITYSAAIVTWQGLAGGGVQVEFYAALLVVAAMVVMLVTFLAIVCERNRRFYPLVASVMALDGQHLNTSHLIRRRWKVILKHYEPKPLHCFNSVFGKISNLLAVKFVAWIFSAFFVFVTIFNMRK